jgi:raffinose/stachyose/melibiose transport system substrate-binding protein
MKRNLICRLTIIALLTLAVTPLLSHCSPQPSPTPSTPSPTPVPVSTKAPQDVVITLGGWRTSTGRLQEVLARFNATHPGIIVRFEPSSSGEYDPVLKAQLESGAAPDLFYLRSFSKSETLYDQGYLTPLSNLPGLKSSFEPAMLAPWTAEDGTLYGVPFTATSHGIYYNEDLFAELGLSVPQTWGELLATAETLEGAGYIAFANGTKDSWTVAEILFMNIAPNYIGGREGRMAYLEGERCFDDAHVVQAFQAIEALEPHLPAEHALLGYIDSLQLFVQGKAAMWMSGSWDIPYFEEAEPGFDWSVFAVPPPAGQPGYVTFHLDVGIGLNATSNHPEEARAFLTWMTTPEFGELLGNAMPGFFPMHKQSPTLTNGHANAFLALNEGRETDIRFAWERLGDGEPTGYALMQSGAQAVLEGEQTPEEAAAALQAGLAQWFEPAQSCQR